MVGVVLVGVVGGGGVRGVRVRAVLPGGRLVLGWVRVGVVGVVSVMLVVREVLGVVLGLVVGQQLGGRGQELALTRHHPTWPSLSPLSSLHCLDTSGKFQNKNLLTKLQQAREIERAHAHYLDRMLTLDFL